MSLSFNSINNEAVTQIVREALKGQMEVLILRGVDEFVHDASDIDVLVPRNHSLSALMRTAEKAAHAGWKILAVRDIGYLAQICLVKWDKANDQYHAVKIDFFNGLSWCALGRDTITGALLDIRTAVGEQEAIALVTLLQKLMYSGYLSKRDRARIAAGCDINQIEAFINKTELPLSRKTLEKGVLSKIIRWRLRAASSDVGLANVLSWIVKVIWRRIRFTFIRSALPGTSIVLKCVDRDRCEVIAGHFQLLLGTAGFPRPKIVLQSGFSSLNFIQNLLHVWYVLCGDILLKGQMQVDDENSLTHQEFTTVHTIIIDCISECDDDLAILLDSVSQHSLNTLRRLENR